MNVSPKPSISSQTRRIISGSPEVSGSCLAFSSQGRQRPGLIRGSGRPQTDEAVGIREAWTVSWRPNASAH